MKYIKRYIAESTDEFNNLDFLADNGLLNNETGKFINTELEILILAGLIKEIGLENIEVVEFENYYFSGLTLIVFPYAEWIYEKLLLINKDIEEISMQPDFGLYKLKVISNREGENTNIKYVITDDVIEELGLK